MALEKKKKLPKKLRIKFGIFALIFLISFFLAFYYSITDSVPFKIPLIGFFVGILIGGITSRIQNVTWDQKGEQIITNLDWVGGFLLVSYFIFLYFKNSIVNFFVHLPHISAIIFALNAGVMFGRILTMRHKIKKILREISTKE